MNKSFEKWLDALPYPAVILQKESGNLRCNRMARRLLPPAVRLRGILAELFDGNEDLLQEIRLESVSYLLVGFSVTEGERLFCFFEHLLPLQEAISRVLVQKMRDFFWLLANRETEPKGNNTAYLDQIAARVCALRSRSDEYLRLLDVPDGFCEESKSCCLDGFFTYLQRALDIQGIHASFSVPKGVTVVSQGTILSYLVLNLLYFVHLYEGEHRIKLLVLKENTHVRFSVSFRDEMSIMSSLESLIYSGDGDENVLRILPMLCILRVCLENQIPWTLQRNGASATLSFLLPKGEEKPVLFLSDAVSAETAKLMEMVKIFFS